VRYRGRIRPGGWRIHTVMATTNIVDLMSALGFEMDFVRAMKVCVF
jgi:hypothetical protein